MNGEFGMLKDKNKIKRRARERRHWLIRKKISGTSARPRLVVFRSLKHIYAQLIDDVEHKTLVSCSSLAKDFKPEPDMKKTEISFQVGFVLGEKAVANGIKEVCFDRAGYRYHGRVKALADGARKAGLIF